MGSIVLGKNNTCQHNNCVLIGENLKSDRRNQMLIDVDGIEGDWDLDEREVLLIGYAIRAYIKQQKVYERDKRSSEQRIG